MAMVASRFDIWLVSITPNNKSKTPVYPCLIVSPDELNRHLDSLIVAPITRDQTNYPTRIDCRLADQSAKIALDQLTAINKSNLTKKLGTLPSPLQEPVLETLSELFAP